MLAITNTNNIGGVLSLTTNYSFTNKKGIPGLLFTPFIGDSDNTIQYIIFTEFKKKLMKSGNPLSLVDHFCVISLTDEIYSNKLKIGKIEYLIGPVNDIHFKYLAMNHYFPHFELKPHKCILSNDSISQITSFVNSFIKDPSFNYDVITIDPFGSKDIDDAFSYVDSNNFIIHIADPNKINHLIDLSKYYDMYTSIYEGDKVYHLLPLELSTNLLSLIANTVRSVISIHFQVINKNEVIITNIQRRNVYITKNMTYDEASHDDSILPMFNLIKQISGIYSKTIEDMHDMIELMMLLTNHLIGNFLVNKKMNPLFRAFQHNEQDLNNQFNAFACYSFTNNQHALLGLSNYVHFTSPIRRSADYYTHQLLLNTLYGEEITYKINETDLIKMNDILFKIKLISNKCNMIYLANKIINGNIYRCLLQAQFTRDNFVIYKWYICDYNMSFYVKMNKNIAPSLSNKYNYYDLILYKLTIGKIHVDKIFFELI